MIRRVRKVVWREMENMYDIHCHALQQVDDGADSLQMALDMLAYEYTEGVRTIILTCLLYTSSFSNSSSGSSKAWE